jgi:hypothetical protein
MGLGREAVAFGVIRLTEQDRGDQARQIGRVHLTVAIHLDHDPRAQIERTLIAGQSGAADALVLGQPHQMNALVRHRGGDHVAGRLGTGIVDADHALHPSRNLRQHIENLRPYPIAGDHDPKAGLVQGCGVPHRRLARRGLRNSHGCEGFPCVGPR